MNDPYKYIEETFQIRNMIFFVLFTFTGQSQADSPLRNSSKWKLENAHVIHQAGTLQL